jgi:beta-xylosidase
VIGGNGYRMFDYRLWSTSDMVNWRNDGVIMRYSNFSWAHGGNSTGNANAGHVTHRKDAAGKSKFYFYAPLDGGQSGYGISIGVAVADRPEGPFTDARGIPLIYLADTASYAEHAWRNLDPAVFVDSDGRAYIYWGNGRLFWAELESDMIHLKGETYTLNAQGKMQNRGINAVKLNTIDNLTSYTEAPYVSKHGNLYYLTYASGFPETISYATSNSPRGPWQYRGVIMDRVQGTGTIHQSLFDFKGATYMSYHTAALPNGGDYRRSTAMDRVYFNGDGTIKKVIPTKK